MRSVNATSWVAVVAIVVSAASGLLGVYLGKYYDRATERERFLRERRLDVYLAVVTQSHRTSWEDETNEPMTIDDINAATATIASVYLVGSKPAAELSDKLMALSIYPNAPAQWRPSWDRYWEQLRTQCRADLAIDD